MKFLFLPSSAQRKRRSGLEQPGRLFLADGTELKNIAVFTLDGYSREQTRLVVEFEGPIKVERITKRPVRRKAD